LEVFANNLILLFGFDINILPPSPQQPTSPKCWKYPLCDSWPLGHLR
jgi:hypothetical protein